jgi:hypothetical protein
MYNSASSPAGAAMAKFAKSIQLGLSGEMLAKVRFEAKLRGITPIEFVRKLVERYLPKRTGLAAKRTLDPPPLLLASPSRLGLPLKSGMHTNACAFSVKKTANLLCVAQKMKRGAES